MPPSDDPVASPPAFAESLVRATRQQQFLNVISREEATQKFREHLALHPRDEETVSLDEALGRVLSRDIPAPLDVPAFDRSNVDGFAVRADDTTGAQEESPRALTINDELLLPGRTPTRTLAPGTATPIATGGMLPRGADAVVMIEDTHSQTAAGALQLAVARSVVAGANISFAGSDIARGETTLWAGQPLTSREIGVLAALGQTTAAVWRRPVVAILSTGDEVVAPGEELPPGCVYDSNAAILAAAVRECGGQPQVLGRVRDDLEQLQKLLQQGLACDLVLLSGGTSKGAGDLSYEAVRQLPDPGIVAHGVALKPGKPICLAVTRGKAVVVLPGFPTSAIFTFHEFVAPVIRQLAGLPAETPHRVAAELPIRVRSERGRTEYTLVRLFQTGQTLRAFPMGKGSGSVTTFSHADGFISIGPQQELLDAGEPVEVTLLDARLRAADLTVIGSHCCGLDFLIGEMRRRGRSAASLYVGSQAGLQAVRRGECDLAGIHLLDPETARYNAPFLDKELLLIPGYARMQCLLCRADDGRFPDADARAALQRALSTPGLVMVNRNPGSGTRILFDRLLHDVAGDLPRPPDGYANQVRSHNSVAAAIAQGRADWGIAIDTVARDYGLRAFPLQEEQYDFVVRRDRANQPAIREFRSLLAEPDIRSQLAQRGFRPSPQLPSGD